MAVSVVVAVAVVAPISVVEVAVVYMTEVWVMPALPTGRGDPELLKLWKGAPFGEEAVFKEAVSLSR